MKWSMLELKKFKEVPLNLSETLDLKADILARFSDFILDITPVTVQGFLEYKNEDVYIHAQVTGSMTVPSSRSLKPVEMPFDFAIDETYTTEESHLERYEITDSVIVLENDVLNFNEAIEEYLMLQIPLQILAEDEVVDDSEMPSGNGWEVLTEDQLEAKKANTTNIDPRLAKLKDLFPDQEEGE
ncbi:YceD family protein [Periweissella ghanensis]|uniref:DUF177 domain-containing protein n=1 Tax=Periweissella ghanensis TaxID=467997 RepID=A0ABM8ZE87_9LACO|nr:YceD family protein [Periweissella ghanensis]MCM0601452.1 DUF177 domain-containing protein [Periweissella ghanensis]CAH0419504.1 hypothetical protein WGH24286_01963 [Periweissella ghanensis]